jgi:hypothetical protein
VKPAGTLSRIAYVVAAACTAICVAPWATTAHADSAPFADSNIRGAIGLCDAEGHPIRSGSLSAKPFVPLAAVSVVAPVGYTPSEKAKATLYMFQPRQEVDPGEWSGVQLTGSSFFFDSSRPMTAATNLDPSLNEAVTAFPARWDGLVELRIYFTAPNKVAVRRTYPAAILRVQGNSWTVVQGANLPCDKDKVLSSERILLPSSTFNQPSSRASGTAPSASATRGSSPTSAVVKPPATSASPPSGLPSQQATVVSKKASFSAPLFLTAAVLLLAAAVGTLVWRRRTGHRRVSGRESDPRVL